MCECVWQDNARFPKDYFFIFFSNQIQQDVTPLKPATTGRGNAVKRKARQAVAEVTQPLPQRLRKAKKIFDPSDL